ncbi:hypothetical protein EMPS_06797 [Entomortierella parvispora]|uniref:Uncharacterized protein n=1 Tax=Entomortierella parvispora TaxID=205924 RepID=A0A9P3LXR8_9FUNG|nr:hypothetical protein EMPS_06797 [Entomortierella parvispora]
MPLLLKAVPLVKGWYGVHYWSIPAQQDLPVELEYISFTEFEDRFAKLNKIARSRYPTLWPNVVMGLVLIALTATAVIGIMQSGSNLSILGKGACFILPVLIVVWYKIRKEINEIALKKFRHRSQRLLRTWTNQDAASHAIQWKLRLRSETVARQSLRAQRHNLSTSLSQLDQSRVMGWQHSTTDLIPARVPQQEQQPQQPQLPLPPVQQQPNLEGPSDQEGTLGVDFISAGAAITGVESADEALDVPPSPRRSSVVQMYQTLRINTRRLSRAMASETRLEEPRPLPVVRTTTSSSTLFRGDTDVEAYSFRTSLQSMMKSIRCCSYFFRERKVWLIEISLRESQLDEYMLTVPSPVYCGYRLPGYEDAIAGNLSNTTTSMGADSSRIMLDRYIGSPPDYLSDSEAEDDGHDDDDEDINDRRNTNHDDRAGEQRIVTEDLQAPMQSTPEMVMLKQSDELTSVVIMGPTSLHQLAATSSGGSASSSTEPSTTRPVELTSNRVSTLEDERTASTLSLPLSTVGDEEESLSGSSNGKKPISTHS